MHNLDLHVKPINQCKFGGHLDNGRKLLLTMLPSLLVFMSYSSNMSLAVPSRTALHLNRWVIQQHFS